MNQKEVWADVKGYEGYYQVSSLGNVKSLERRVWNKANKSFSNIKGMILKNDIKSKLYYQVGLTKKGCRKSYLGHRLVAQAFISNPENKPQVNHINEIKTDNSVNNLEWVTSSYNINYGKRSDIVSKKASKPVVKLTLNGVLLSTYKSALLAEKDGYSRFCISMCCKNKIKSHAGFNWQYL